MSWLERYIRPQIRSFRRQAEAAAPSSARCPACQQVLVKAELEHTLRVCGHCGHHLPLHAAERLRLTLDAGYRRLDQPKAATDPLRFRDQRRYMDQLKEACAETGLPDALVAAQGTILARPAVVAAMEFGFMGGSLGAAVGEAFVTAAQESVRSSLPLIVFATSNGPRVQEGAISLMQMPRTVLATRLVRRAGLPYIVVLTDPTIGAVTASFAMLGDILIAEPAALISFGGAHAATQEARESVPLEARRAEYLHKHGHLDMIVTRAQMREALARLISLLTRAPHEHGPPLEEEEPLTW